MSEDKLYAWKEERKTNKWAKGLPVIVLVMNAQVHSTTGYTPYKVVFRIKLRTLPLPASQRNKATLITESGNEIALPKMGPRSDVVQVRIDISDAQESGADAEESEADAEESGVWRSQEHIDSSIILARVQANTAKARTQMSLRYSKFQQIAPSNVGDLVSLYISRIDRYASNAPRLFCNITLKSHADRYQLLTLHGILNRYYPTRGPQDPLILCSPSSTKQIPVFLLAVQDGDSIAK
ncbi:hypothetical protein BGX38DRAFT_1140909 [Terfezia claveryi]|nr:hypothetical protein BGX38DRAFT_1140909 [Terfezia claveryi]